MLIPDSTWPVVYNYDEPEEVSVMASETDLMSSVGKKVEDIMNQAVTGQTGSGMIDSEEEMMDGAGSSGADSGNVSYKAADLLKTVKNLQKVSENTNKQLLWIASISLLVGGIGVMNIMLVSVTERTREIGIRKSLGAKTSSIMLQFLAEAAILTVMGGVIGIILGILAGYGICSIMSGSMGMTITPGISPTVILAATLFSCAVGVFFGIYPAKKAAKLSPIEALRRN